MKRKNRKRNVTPTDIVLLFSRVSAVDGKMVAARRLCERRGRRKWRVCVRACVRVCVFAQESEERAASFPDPLIGIGSTLKEGHWRIRRLVVWLVVRCKGPAEKWRGGSLSDAVISQRPSSFNRDSIVPPCLIYSIERNDQFPFITFYFHRYIYIYMYNRE